MGPPGYQLQILHFEIQYFHLKVAMPRTTDGLRLCSFEGKEGYFSTFSLKRGTLIDWFCSSSDWCDWIGNGWQCPCQELEKRRVGRI